MLVYIYEFGIKLLSINRRSNETDNSNSNWEIREKNRCKIWEYSAGWLDI